MTIFLGMSCCNNISKMEDGDIVQEEINVTCALDRSVTFNLLWDSPRKLPGTNCENREDYIRRIKIARVENPDTFLAFYSTTETSHALKAQAYTIKTDGITSMCNGEEFTVINGDNPNIAPENTTGRTYEIMDFNVIRKNTEGSSLFYIAYSTTVVPPPAGGKHYVHGMIVKFDNNNCEINIIEDYLIKDLDDNHDCVNGKGGEPWFLDRGDNILFAEWSMKRVSIII